MNRQLCRFVWRKRWACLSGVSVFLLNAKPSRGRMIFTTVALATAVATFLNSPIAQTRADVFCTTEHPCGCSYNVSVCFPTGHMDTRIECGPTHKSSLYEEIYAPLRRLKTHPTAHTGVPSVQRATTSQIVSMWRSWHRCGLGASLPWTF